MKFKFFIVTLLVILVAFLSASSVCAADVTQDDASDNIMNDFSVLVTSDSSDMFSNDVNSLSAGGDSFSDLQGLIDKTSKGGTLDLDKNYSFNKNTDNDEGVSITKDITINGNGFTLDGKNLARILNISGSTVTINNLNFVNANVKYDYYYGSGGAIFANYSDLTLNGCTFENNNGTYGGAIYFEYGDLIIDNCSFVDNSADDDGGAIYFYGDSSTYDDKLSIVNCIFTSNDCTYDGGAVYFDYGDFTVTNCTFKDNSAPESDGGAIYVEEGNLAIENSVFEHNWDGDCCGGGAIYFEDGNFTVKNTNFTDNYVEASSCSVYGGAIYCDPNCYGNVVISACNFNNNYIVTDNYAQGGAIYTDDGNVTIVDSNFTGNYIDTENYAYGGALYIGYGSLDIDNCKFDNNYIDSSYDSSSNYGGCIYYYNQYDDYDYLTITDSNFTGNYINSPNYYSYGGCIYADTYDVNIDNSNFIGNYLYNDDDGSYGGTIYADYNLTITNSNVINSSATEDGGAIYLSDGAIIMDNCSIINTSSGYYGAVKADNGGIVTNSKFINNKITAVDGNYGYGAAIYSYDNLTVMNSVFENNFIEVTSSDCDAEGGAIYFSGDSLELNNCSFANNGISTVDDYAYGGAVYCYGECAITDCSFVNNSVSGGDPQGGAIYYDYYGEITVDHCIFDGNVADKGNAIATYYDNCTYSFDKNYWSMNFTTVDEFINADLIYLEHWDNHTGEWIDYGYSVAPDNWVLMSISGPSDVKVGYKESYIVEFDKLTDGVSVSDFSDSMPDYVTSIYAFNTAADPNYNHKWDGENPSVGEFVANVSVVDGVGSFVYVAPAEDTYYFRAFSPLTNWEESVMGPVEATMPVADVEITMVSDNTDYRLGDKVTYTITVTNNGPDKALDTIVRDVLPKGLKFQYAVASKGVYENGVWNVGDLADGESATLTIHVIAEKAGTIVNTASVSTFSIDTNPDNDEVSVSINVLKKIDPVPVPDPVPTPVPTPVKDVSTLPKAGNPLALVVLSLLTLCVGGLKRKL